MKLSVKIRAWGLLFSDRGIFFLGFIVVILLFSSSWQIQQEIIRKSQEDTGRALTTILNSTQQGLTSWIENHSANATVWAGKPELVYLTEKLLLEELQPAALNNSLSQKKIRTLLQPVITKNQYKGFFVVNPRGINLASMRDNNVGQTNLLLQQPDTFSKIIQGKTALTLPQVSDVPMRDKDGLLRQRQPTMFMGTPIRAKTGKVIAALLFRIDPLEDFSAIMNQAAFGDSGETYAFDVNGLLISESLFPDRLQQHGIIIADSTAMLNLYIRDPGVNHVNKFVSATSSVHPLTLMAASAVTGNAGINLEGYRNYHGVPVVGSWTWNEHLGFGIATETDVAQVYATLDNIILTLKTGTVFLISLVTVLVINFARNHSKIKHNERFNRAITESMAEGLIVINQEGIITAFNPAAEGIFAYSAGEILGSNIKVLMPEPDKEKHDDYLQHYLETAQPKIIGAGRELQGRRKDGSLFPMELVISAANIDNKEIFTGIVRDISTRKNNEAALEINHHQIEVVKRAQERFISGRDPINFFEDILPEILALTSSEFGFIGEIRNDADGAPYLKIYAISNIAWDEKSQALYDENTGSGLEFHNLETLFGQVIVTKKALISNDPASDPRSGGVPTGHQPLRSFLGLPIYSADRMVGMVAMANKQGGYDESIINFLQPVISTCAQIFNAMAAEKERQRNSLELNRTNSFLARLIENMRVGILVEDEHGIISALNQTYCDMFSKKDLLLHIEGTDCENAFSIDQAFMTNPHEFELHRRHCLQNEQIVNGKEFTLLDGRVYEQHYAPVVFENDQGGSKRSHLWSYYDISEHKQAQEKQKQQTRKLAKFANEEHTLSILLRLTLEPTEMEEFLDSSLKTLVKSPNWKKHKPQIAIFLTKDEAKERSLYLAAKYGFPAELHNMCAQTSFNKCLCGLPATQCLALFASNTEPLHDISFAGMSKLKNYSVPLLENETVIGMLAIYLPFDHKHSLQNQASLEQVGEVLAMGIGRRYNNRRLMKAKDKAEAATTAKGQFLATMSHEIRTPMNGVLGMLFLLGKTKLSNRQRRLLETATGSNRMLLKIIDDVLNFSKLESSKFELEIIDFKPATIVEESAALMAEIAHKKSLDLICVPSPELPHMVKGDPTRLRQILTNLLSNAIKFTQNGEVVIAATPLGNDHIHFSVQDTGIGMSTSEQRRLFKAFTQVDSSHTRKYGGTGLGLAISEHLVRAMGSEFHVISAQGIGSEFSFEIELQTIVKSAPQEKYSALLSSKRVLLASSNSTQSKALKNILGSWNIIHTQESDSDTAALDILLEANLRNSSYDFVIVDLHKPEINSKQLVRSIRNHESLKDMAIISLSSNIEENSIIGVDAYVNKPILRSELYNSFLFVLGLHQTDKKYDSNLIINNRHNLQGRKLLLVEDNLINQEVAKEILNEAGFRIDVIGNGIEAVQAVQYKNYDIVLMDIQMPLMDGLEATSLIRSLGGKYKDLPIIAMTAHALTGDAEKSLSAGMNGHITKPLEPEILFKELSLWINGNENTHVQTDKPVSIDINEIPHIAGLDTADGLGRLNGNWEVYKRILNSFCEQHSNAAEKFAVYLKDSNWTDARNLAHTIKGSGGNLGAKDVYKIAGEMEQICINEDMVSAKAQLRLLKKGLEEIIVGFNKFTSEYANYPIKIFSDTSSTSTQPDNLTLNNILHEIEKYLDSDLGEAQSRILSLRKQRSNNIFTSMLDNLQNAMNNFEIDAAKVIINDIRKLEHLHNS